MVLRRFLMYFSYSGTQFKGVQRQRPRDCKFNEDPSTVQGLIEYSLSRLKPKNDVVLMLSSRTDQGVHAVRTAACVDLDFSFEIERKYIQYSLNKFFDETDLDIRILSVCEVNKEFNPRGLALWRKYLYKLATLKPGIMQDNQIHKYLIPIPATEQKRCFYVPNTKFDLDAVREASKLFIGTKDFLTFMSKPSSQPVEVTTVRTIMSLDIERGVPCPFSQFYNYWNITCQGRSFLYKQVRRIVSVLLQVAQGHLSLNKVQQMIEEPSPNNWPSRLHHAPAHGLYLMDVVYDKKDLEIPSDLVKEEVDASVLDPIQRMEKRKTEIKEKLQKLRETKTLLYDTVHRK